MQPFKREQRRMYGGFTWYCQVAGRLWATDPDVGWELEYRTGEGTPGWHLYGGDAEKGEYTAFGEFMDAKFNQAIREAAQYIKEGKQQ